MTRYEVGDQVQVATDGVAIPGTGRTFAVGARGWISAPGAGNFYEVTFNTTGGPILATIHESRLESAKPEPEPEPEPGHFQAAIDHLAGTVGPGSISEHTRSIMVADVFARLEQARQMGRIANALERLAESGGI